MRVLHRPRPVEASPAHRAPAWPGRPSADDSISFADIAAMPDPDWIGRSQNAGLALDAELLEPLELTNWSYWLNRQFGNAKDRNATPDSIEARLRALATDTSFALYGIAKDIDAGLPSLSIADFIAELDDDRGAMLANVNAERVLIVEQERECLAERLAEQQLAQERWFATEVLGLDGNRDFGEQLRERDAESEADR